jgi:hypothetical protein
MKSAENANERILHNVFEKCLIDKGPCRQCTAQAMQQLRPQIRQSRLLIWTITDKVHQPHIVVSAHDIRRQVLIWKLLTGPSAAGVPQSSVYGYINSVS